jgi:hypothetical protein
MIRFPSAKISGGTEARDPVTNRLNRAWRPGSCGAVILLAGALALGGCHKSAPPPAAPPATNQQAAAVQAAPASQPDMPELNRALMRWVLGHRRTPANFEDFASSAGVTIPPPPPGKKYLLRKDMHIVLVDR